MPRLSAKPVVNYQNSNSFKYANQWEVGAANSYTLYFQFIDLDQCGLRYMAGVGSSNMPVAAKVTFPSIDCSKVITLIATQDSVDRSIWSVTMPLTSTPQTGNVRFELIEGSSVKNFSVLQMITVQYPNDGSDGTLPDNTYYF